MEYFTLKKNDGSSFHIYNEISGFVRFIENGKILVRILSGFDRIRSEDVFEILFEINTISFRVQHMTLQMMKKQKLFEVLIDNTKFNETLTNGPGHMEIYDDIDPSLNPEQRIAVKSIVCKNEAMPPYILYGPPGTGKTKTLVATIEYIIKNSSENVLVCAMSNRTCDEFAERLMAKIDNKHILRIFAKSHRIKKVDEKLMEISNRSEFSFELPALESIYKHRVVVCTLCESNNLARKRNWRPDFFQYIFIDECACSLQTMAVAPIVGLVTKQNEVLAKIVLAGDPQQLEAVVKSQIADQYGFKTSYMELLMSKKVYAPTPEYNRQLITQLVKNYRSHSSILDVPNRLFYDESLEPMASSGEFNLLFVIVIIFCPL